MNPDVVRKEEVIQELRQRLEGILPQDIPFQPTPRYLNITEQKGSNQRFNFKAIAIECDRKDVKTVQESFYQLGNPKEAREHWLITEHCSSHFWKRKLLSITKYWEWQKRMRKR